MTDDLKIVAAPEPAHIPEEVRRLNAALLRDYPNPFGEAMFRFVDARVATTPFQGRLAMRYPDASRACDVEVSYLARAPEGGLLVIPDALVARDAEEWPEHLRPYASALLVVDSVVRQYGTPRWALEGWISTERAADIWDEDFGERPSRGVYTLLWYCEDERGRERLPAERDLEEIRRRTQAQASDPLLRDARWDGRFEWSRVHALSDRSRRAEAKRREARGAAFEADAEREIRKRLKSHGF